MIVIKCSEKFSINIMGLVPIGVSNGVNENERIEMPN